MQKCTANKGQIPIVMLGQVGNLYVRMAPRKNTIQSCHSIKWMIFMNPQIDFVLFLRGNLFMYDNAKEMKLSQFNFNLKIHNIHQ